VSFEKDYDKDANAAKGITVLRIASHLWGPWPKGRVRIMVRWTAALFQRTGRAIVPHSDSLRSQSANPTYSLSSYSLGETLAALEEEVKLDYWNYPKRI
jgi:hypothetical protein